jgi:hypothetical protein
LTELPAQHHADHAVVLRVLAVPDREQPLVVVADDAVRAQGFQGLEHLDRIRAVPDRVTQADDAVEAARRGIVQHGLERLEVGVDVGKQQDSHWCEDNTATRSDEGAAPIREVLD